MNCQNVRNYLLTADTTQPPGPEITEHLHQCPACRAYAGQLHSALDWLQRQPAPVVPSRINRRLRRRLFESKRKPRLAPALALAVLLAVIAVMFTLRPEKPEKPTAYFSANEFTIKSMEYHGAPLHNLQIVLNKDFINVFVTSEGGKNHE